jgi:uncharacterized protein
MIRNLTRDVMLHPAAEVAANAWRHALGFMFRRPADRAIVFVFAAPREVVVHTYFVRGALDVLVLDFEHHVLAMEEKLAPWRVWSAGVRARIVVELPAGTLAASKTEIGDRLELPSLPI